MQIGRYELIAEIARGGMGIVYLAVARGPSRFNKLVVVKELKPELAEDEGFLEMFLEEARLAARLNHRNIVQTHEVGNDGPHHFMVMDYLEGVTLGRIIRKKVPRFTLAMHIRVLAEMLVGLHHAHTLADYDGTLLGIVHRDATPQNIFVTFDGDVKLVDFGIAKALDSTVETRTGLFKGKPSYMAPEQIGGAADPRSDLFTVGVMLWEAIAGQRMWKSTKASDVEILTAMSLGRVPSLAAAAPETPAPLLAIVDRALQKDRGARFQTALEMRAALEGYLAASGDDPSLSQIGEVVNEAFGDTRAKMRTFIEAHLAEESAALRSGRSLQPPPVSLETFTEPLSRHSRIPGATQTHTALSAGVPPPPGLPSHIAEIASLAPVPAPPPSRRGLVAGLAAFFAVAVAGTVIAMKVRQGHEPAAVEIASAAPAIVSATPSATAEPEPVAAVHEISLAVFPKGAKLVIDGAEAENPVKKLCHQGNSIVVRALKAGYAAAERTLGCERDQTVEIALVAEPQAPPVYRPTVRRPPSMPAPPPPTRPATPAPGLNPNGGTAPLRPIDPTNPYKR